MEDFNIFIIGGLSALIINDGLKLLKKCNKSFLSSKYLSRHIKLCLGELKCKNCNKILSRKQTYLNHIKKCSKNL